MKSAAPILWLLGCCALRCAPRAAAADGPLLREPTFEDLANLVVTTVSRHEERVFTAPAATSVLPGDVVLRSGAASVPEALRLVPGFNVAQISPDAWAVGARGFQWQLANKLLVMVDGRSIYSTAVGGVPWEDNPVFLDDLARIEAVRGPGAVFWGSNAVNGVVDIVTRDAFETVGGHSYVRAGNRGRLSLGARQGWRLGPAAALRVFAAHDEEEAGRSPLGADARNGYRRNFGGARLDWTPAEGDRVTLQAGAHERRTEYVRVIDTLQAPAYRVTRETPVTGRGWNSALRWQHALAGGDTLELAGFVDHVVRERPQFREHVTSTSLDSVWNQAPGPAGHWSAGAGVRWLDTTLAARLYEFVPERTRPVLFHAFLNDEITLRPDVLRLGAGTKVEHHSDTGWNVQPSLRLTWQPRPDWVAWAALSRAVRTPTTVELTAALDAAVYPPGVLDPVLPAVVRLEGNPDLAAETLTACEGGLRWTTPAGCQVDFTAFSYDYRHYTMATGAGFGFEAAPVPALLVLERFRNGLDGETYGGELSVGWEPLPGWHLNAQLAYVQIQLHTPFSDPLSYERDEETTPDFTARLGADWQISPRWQLNVSLRRVGQVSYYGIPAYVALDARAAWRVGDRAELAVTARNLGDPWHPEYDSAFNRSLAEVGRSFSFDWRWNF